MGKQVGVSFFLSGRMLSWSGEEPLEGFLPLFILMSLARLGF